MNGQDDFSMKAALYLRVSTGNGKQTTKNQRREQTPAGDVLTVD